MTWMLQPRLTPMHLTRAADLALRLNVALAVGICLGGDSGFWPEPELAPTVTRDFQQLWEEYGRILGHLEVLPSGLVAAIVGYLAGRLVVPVLPSRPPSEYGRVAAAKWWLHSVRRREALGVVLVLAMALCVGVSTIAVASVNPPHQAARAMAQFTVAVVAGLFALPVFLALAQACLLSVAVRISCFDTMLSVCPGIFDFSHAHVRTMATQEQLLRHAAAFAAERRATKARAREHHPRPAAASAPGQRALALPDGSS